MQTDSLVNRLNQFITSTGLTTTQFADAAAIPRPTLSQILSGRNKKISNEILEKLHAAFENLDILWLLFGQKSDNRALQSPNAKPGPAPVAISAAGKSSDTGARSANASAAGQIASEYEEMATYGRASLGDDHSLFGFATTGYTGERSNTPNSEPVKNGFTNVNNSTTGQNTSSLGESFNRNEFNGQASVQTNRQSGGIETSKPNLTEKTPDTPCPSKQRHVVSIMVFYSDNSYEVFKPERQPLD